MKEVRESILWERLYDMDAFGLSDFLNDLFPVENGEWRSTQHGECVWLQIDGQEAGFKWGDWPKWRQEVSYYFPGMVDSCAKLKDEAFCDVMVFKLVSMLFRDILESRLYTIEKREPKQAKKLLFM
jgi:hypothetical protein